MLRSKKANLLFCNQCTPSGYVCTNTTELLSVKHPTFNTFFSFMLLWEGIKFSTFFIFCSYQWDFHIVHGTLQTALCEQIFLSYLWESCMPNTRFWCIYINPILVYCWDHYRNFTTKSSCFLILLNQEMLIKHLVCTSVVL